MNESKKRALTLTPNSGLQSIPGKKRTLNGSPQRTTKSSPNAGDSMDWKRQYLVQSNELQRIKKLKEFLELEKDARGRL